MSNADTFVAAVRREAPAHTLLIDARAALLGSEPARLRDDLVQREVLPKARLLQLWGDALGVAYVNPMAVDIPTGATQQLPVDVARRTNALVINAIPEGATVAMADPANTRLVESLAKILGRQVSPVYAHESELRAAIDMFLGDEGNIDVNLRTLSGQIPALFGGREIGTTKDVQEFVEAKGVAELLNSIILTAYRRRASDVHFEPRSDASRVRMRIDGDMLVVMEIPRALHLTLLGRLKVLCQLDMTETRLPQDGAFEVHFGALNTSFRVATVPTIHGEKAVMRVLGSPLSRSVLRLDTLGLGHATHEALKRVLARPNGIVIACGPTGSGKTTTLYSCIGQLNEPDLNITTIEDPVEYRMPGVTQHQVNPTIGLTFQRVLRSVMRQDPDVILVGEVRDRETALIAAEAALTGHLVLTTLHTNNAVQAVMRLVEIGVEPYIVAPILMGVVSQRLVRRICPACKTPYEASEAELAPHFHNLGGAPVNLFRGTGCAKCGGTGYHGRIGLYEFLEVSERMRDLISQRASVPALMEEAARVGHRSLRYDGLKKALMGWTTLEEVERNTPPDVSYEPVSG